MSVKRNKKNTGFTIVELMVSVAIFVLITSVILARHSQFSNTILIENLAYDIALSIRKAQVFGLSAKEFEIGSDEFNVGYGVHFKDNSSYIFFADASKDDVYSSSSIDVVIDTLTLGGGNKISKFCVSSPLKCSTDALPINSLDIIFNRPNPDAIITIDSDNSLEYASAEVTIRSAQGTEWTINVGNTGQISVQKP